MKLNKIFTKTLFIIIDRVVVKILHFNTLLTIILYCHINLRRATFMNILDYLNTFFRLIWFFLFSNLHDKLLLKCLIEYSNKKKV